MMEKGKISPLQLAILMYPVVAATGDLIVPAITAADAKRDMWLSPIWSSLAGFLIIFITYRLHRLYPKETPIQYSTHILGKIPGMIVGALYIFILLYDGAFILWEYADFIAGWFLNKTPMIFIMGSMAAVCAFAVRGGVEVLGRASQIIMPVVILVWLLLVILLFPEYEFANLLPVMENGIMPSIKGAVTPEVWFSLFFLASFLFPYLTEPQKGLKWGMVSVFFVMLVLSLLNLSALLVFGGITGSLTYPLMSAARYISFAEFFEHVESLATAIWVASVFIKLSVYYYVLVLSTAQWLKLSNQRPVILPLGLLLILFGKWSFSNIQEMSDFSKRIVPLYENMFYLIIPMLLLLLALIKKKHMKA